MSYSKYLINVHKTMRDAILKMNINKKQFLLVLDKDKNVIASVTDGDIRRSLVRKVNIDVSIKDFANFKPIRTLKESKEDVLKVMNKHKINQLPLIDRKGRLKKIFFKDEILIESPVKNSLPVVIMAGGKGLRLRPLTIETPKPMLEINGKPMIQLVIENLKLSGFKNFYISVNYKANLIKDYLKKMKNFDVNIDFLHEKKRLGTIGSLTLLKEGSFNNILVINSDVMTNINFDSMLKFHNKHKSDMTIGVKKISQKIDFGIVLHEKNKVHEFQEKPDLSFDICAGVYILNKKIVRQIPKDTNYDVNHLIAKSLKLRRNIKSFQIFEDWSDIGNMKEYNFYKNVSKK